MATMDAIGKQIQSKIDSARALFGAVEKMAKNLTKALSVPGVTPKPPTEILNMSKTLPRGQEREISTETKEVKRAAAPRPPIIRAATALAEGLQVELAAQETRYVLVTGHIYFKAAVGGESGRLAARDEFTRAIASEDFIGSLDRLVQRVETGLAEQKLRFRGAVGPKRPPVRGRTAGRAETKEADSQSSGASFAPNQFPVAIHRALTAGCAEIQRLIDAYPRAAPAGPNIRNSSRAPDAGTSAPNTGLPRVDYESCPDCSAEMIVDPDHSERMCRACGATRELVGTVFDDAQFYSQEGQKAKSGTFNPNRHFQFWWLHIYGREPEEEIGNSSDPDNMYGEKMIEKMRAIVHRERKFMRLLTVNDVRGMLKELNLTDLNKNVALIMRKLTGVGPPAPSEKLSHKVEKYFSKAIEIGENIKRESRVNRNYYPYYCAKILDALLPADDHENRRVLYYIYMQSKETLENDDLDWELICSDPEMDGVKYVPTDRTMPMKYRPL